MHYHENRRQNATLGSCYCDRDMRIAIVVDAHLRETVRQDWSGDEEKVEVLGS